MILGHDGRLFGRIWRRTLQLPGATKLSVKIVFANFGPKKPEFVSDCYQKTTPICADIVDFGIYPFGTLSDIIWY